jgi:hypothetical protein
MVIGLLAFYDESPLWLSAAVTGAAKFCDHVIAVDGAYMLYPDGRAHSNPECAEAIVEAANACGVGYTLHIPATVWMGNQVEKRNTMFQLAHQIGSDEDWVYVFDADDLVTDVPADIHQRLEEAVEDVAVFTLWWSEDMHATAQREEAATVFNYPHEGSNRYFRGLFRLIDNLRCEGAHYHYLGVRHELAPFLNVTDLRVQHRHPQRTRQRLDTSAAYDRLVHITEAEIVDPEKWPTPA